MFSDICIVGQILYVILLKTGFFFSERVFLYGGHGAQAFLAAAFLMAARMFLSSCLLLVARMCVLTLFLMNFRALLS